MSARNPIRPWTDADPARIEADRALAELRTFGSTLAYRELVRWLDALAAQQQATMASCPPDRLAAAQVRLAQLNALRVSLTAKDTQYTNGFVTD